MKRLCVFCGSNAGADEDYAKAAVALGELLARRGIGLVTGGGKVGLMGVVADAALAAGGEVIGVIPEDIVRLEVAHESLTKLHVVGSMHERKALMEKLSDGFIALPGGFGTLDELCEIVTWAQLGLHRKPVGVLNVSGYFDKFLEFVDFSVEQGFVKRRLRGLLLSEREPEKLLERFARHAPFETRRWLKSP